MDGKLNKSTVLSTDTPSENKRGVPNYGYKKGRINFVRSKALVGQPTEPMVTCFFFFLLGEGVLQKVVMMASCVYHVVMGMCCIDW